ncbi:sensor histidine kinase [Aureicoccus marinus]|uniref:histidine kinase n=1 Tax=Aureicoccus marinus TaxID=754435 RepID=A0A2S7TA82_9FLAO|nr:HAMP domain-containing sensor histidine kinase [Aureicoccus marinus]PQJ16427.1 two-component sensor histidine kinase [Aureicoccus marinus]
MVIHPRRRATQIILVVVAFGIVSLILWNTNHFFKKFKEEERLKMQIWASSLSELNGLSLEEDPGELILMVQGNNKSTPMILVNSVGAIRTHNLPEEEAKDSLKIQQLIKKFGKQNQPIILSSNQEEDAVIYYGNSEVLNQLKYYPVALLLIIFLFATVIYFFFRTNKIAEQNRLWAGMAKETAHQIGTPLTSLLGWNELLKSEELNPQITREIEKDIYRLQTITERFSKIGSVPDLETRNLVEEAEKTLNYLKRRSSKLIQFSFHTDTDKVLVDLNPALFSWSIENLVKNGIDAMKGKGHIALNIEQHGQQVHVLVSDTGHGIQKGQFQEIFQPGVSSKKRGWGLGLSLVKRIIEEYHQGKIRVMSSSKEGTIMQIVLRKSQENLSA